MEKSVCVILFFLLGGICIQVKAAVAQSYVHCNHHSDCTIHKCSIDKPTPYCKHDYFIVMEIGRHCDCTECVEDRDCNCTTGITPHCVHTSLNGNFGTCQCNPTITIPVVATAATVRSTTLTTLSTTACYAHTDCSGLICPSDKHPYCKIDRHSSTCYCTVCTENKHCFCPPGMIGQCHFDYIHNSHSCVCGIAPVVSTTTSVLPPTDVTQLSTSACHTHTDCSGSICPSDKHPYCKFDRYSSTCHCTVCTEHKHCFCPQGLIGQCHFDYIHNSHSCACGLAPVVSTPTSVQPPTLTQPQSTACHYHADCSGHICPSDKHPYCKIDRYSSACDCTAQEQCLTCDDVLNPVNCNISKQCDQDQICYTEQIHINHEKRFRMGCVSKNICVVSAPTTPLEGIILGKRTNQAPELELYRRTLLGDLNICAKCCKGNNCNADLCRVLVFAN